MEEVSIINENDITLNVVGYFNVDHELELIDVNVYEHFILLLKINFTISRMLEMLALIVGCIS
jgi:hypothetical protein